MRHKIGSSNIIQESNQNVLPVSITPTLYDSYMAIKILVNADVKLLWKDIESISEADQGPRTFELKSYSWWVIFPTNLKPWIKKEKAAYDIPTS